MKVSVDGTIEVARAVANRPGWSKTRLAREAGLSQNALVDLYNPDFNPTADTLRKIELALKKVSVSADSSLPAAASG